MFMNKNNNKDKRINKIKNKKLNDKIKLQAVQKTFQTEIESFRRNLLQSPLVARESRNDKRRKKQKSIDCKFCRHIKSKKDVVFENQHIVVVFGRPHHKGHLVVMPRHHEENLLLLHEKTLDSFLNDTILVMKALAKAIKPDLFNLEYLDNWDSHVHWNVYPRFKSDSDYGNPPIIPKKDEKFIPKYLSRKELTLFKHELQKIKSRLEEEWERK